MSQRQSWGDFYQGAGGVDYLLDHVAIHKEFLKRILNLRPRTALEAGCGSAIMSIFLSMTGVDVMACDRDAGVLGRAETTARDWKAPVRFVKEDILKFRFAENSFDVVFSQGVLEHLDDGQIRAAAAEALRVGQVFIFSVPGEHYRHRDFGDERLLPASAWREILSGQGRLETVPYYFCRTKRNFGIKRPLMLMGILSR